MSLVPVLDPFTVLSLLTAALGVILALIGVATGAKQLTRILADRVAYGDRRDQVAA
jgi:hypothetical protein